jgi:hypothetical protein
LCCVEEALLRRLEKEAPRPFEDAVKRRSRSGNGESVTQTKMTNCLFDLIGLV